MQLLSAACCHGVFRRDIQFVAWHRCGEEKGTVVGEPARHSALTAGKSLSRPTKFSDMSEIYPIVGWPVGSRLVALDTKYQVKSRQKPCRLCQD